MTPEERLREIAWIAEGYSDYMGEPENGGEHWGDCPLATDFPEDIEAAYDIEPDPDDPESRIMTWNEEKAAKLCVCSVGDFWRILKLAKGEQ